MRPGSLVALRLLDEPLIPRVVVAECDTDGVDRLSEFLLDRDHSLRERPLLRGTRDFLAVLLRRSLSGESGKIVRQDRANLAGRRIDCAAGDIALTGAPAGETLLHAAALPWR